MTQRQMQFRVGLFTIVAIAIAAGLTFSFGSLPKLLAPSYEVSVRFADAGGVGPGVPVRQYGLTIGRVTRVEVDFEGGGVIATLCLDPDHKLRADVQPQIVKSLLGDASIELSSGTQSEVLQPESMLVGLSATDPMQVVASMQHSAEQTMASIESTSENFGQLAANMNAFLETEQGSVSQVVERAAMALTELTVAMKQASGTLTAVNQVIGDPQTQANLQRAIAGLPAMLDEARLTVTAVRTAIAGIDQTMRNLSTATAPLAQASPALTASLGRSLGTLEQALADISRLASLLANQNGTLAKLAADPQMYDSINNAAGDLAAVMEALNPTIKDLRIFADKVARHPELLGVRGAMRGSSGLKDVPTARGQSPSYAPSPSYR